MYVYSLRVIDSFQAELERMICSRSSFVEQKSTHDSTRSKCMLSILLTIPRLSHITPYRNDTYTKTYHEENPIYVVWRSQDSKPGILEWEIYIICISRQIFDRETLVSQIHRTVAFTDSCTYQATNCIFLSINKPLK